MAQLCHHHTRFTKSFIPETRHYVCANSRPLLVKSCRSRIYPRYRARPPRVARGCVLCCLICCLRTDRACSHGRFAAEKPRSSTCPLSLPRQVLCTNLIFFCIILRRQTFSECVGALEFAQASEMLVPAAASTAVANDVHEHVLAAVAGGCEG